MIKAGVTRSLTTVKSESQLKVKDLIRMRKQGRFRSDSREVLPSIISLSSRCEGIDNDKD